MGTKLHHVINPLAYSPKNNIFAANRLDDRDCLRNKGLKEKLKRVALDKLQYSMDRMVEQHNLESIKKTMLIHEDIFKQQVRELHRLYSAQKMLMDDMKNGIKHDRFWGPVNNASDINHSHILDQHQATNPTEYNLHFQNMRDNPSSREQGVSCSGEILQMPEGFDLERLAKGNISTRISAIEDQAGPSSDRHPKNSKTSVDESDEESDVELTLSIGGSTGKKRSKKHQCQHSPDLNCSGLIHNKFRERGSSGLIKSEECGTAENSSSAALDQQNKRPHWLFRGLSLNRT